MCVGLDTFRSGKFEIEVLYLDNHVLGVVKPQNMPVQRDSSGDIDLLTACKDYIGKEFNKPGAVYLGLVHRLDRPVGGSMVLARTSKAAARLSKGFSSHDVEKTYLCVLQGALDERRELTDWLLKNERTGNSSVVSAGAPGAKEAKLVTEPIAQKDGLTLARVRLLTGRSHQIRVQHAHIGLPLWGDARYGGGKPGEQIALWAHKLVFEHPTKKEPVCLLSAPPIDGAWRGFRDVLEDMRDGS